MSSGPVSLRTSLVCQSEGPTRLDITRYRVSGLTMSVVKIGDSKIPANAATQTARCPVPEKAGCMGGGRNFISYTPRACHRMVIISHKSQQYLANPSAVRAERLYVEDFGCVVQPNIACY